MGQSLFSVMHQEVRGGAAPIRAGSQFSESEIKDIKGAISHFKRNENSYWNRSIKVSNIGSIPKLGACLLQSRRI